MMVQPDITAIASKESPPQTADESGAGNGTAALSLIRRVLREQAVAFPLSSVGGEGRGEEALVPLTVRTTSARSYFSSYKCASLTMEIGIFCLRHQSSEAST